MDESSNTEASSITSSTGTSSVTSNTGTSSVTSSTGTSKLTTSTNGSEKKGSSLRNFRKEQVSLLRYFRPESKNPSQGNGSTSSSPSSSPSPISSSNGIMGSSSPGTNTFSKTLSTSSSSTPQRQRGITGVTLDTDTSISPIFKRKASTDKPLNNTITNNTTLKTVIQKPSTTVSVRTLSKPLYVGAPSPEMKHEENSNDGDNDQSSSESPLGGMSMKTLISKTSPVKRSLPSSDLDDSQDSPLIRTKPMKRARLVASSDEEDAGDSTKQQVNGHDNSSIESLKKPDDDRISKFIRMWGTVYSFMQEKELMDMYKAKNWDAKDTMIELSKMNKERINREKMRRNEEIRRKHRIAMEKKEKLKSEEELKKQNAEAEETDKQDTTSEESKTKNETTEDSNTKTETSEEFNTKTETTEEERLRQKKEEEERQKRKIEEEKKEQERKQKAKEKEMESLARNAMKLKLKAKKDSWKSKTARKQGEQDMEEEEEDYHVTGGKVYDSDEESDVEETPVVRGDRQLVLQFFNEASIGELGAIGGCSKKKAEMLVKLRPFTDWDDIVHKFQTEKYVNTDLLNEAKNVMHVRSSVQKLMKKCEDIAKEMQSIVSRIVNGEEDAGISKQPDSLNSSMQLKGYQLIGLNWLVLMHEQGLNGVLADEMGLGKTVQAIAFLAHIKEMEDPERQSLIIVPSSTLDNWARELETWCPSLEVLHYHGSQEDRRNLRCAIINETLEEDPHVILTTYNMVTTGTEDRALFKKLRFHTVILDEAHMLKNMASQRYENLMKIKAQRRILLTGTPLQNNLVELMSILIFVMPQLFDSKKEELKRVFQMFPRSDTSGNKGRFERERIEQAKRIMKPFFLRRLKCDVLKDLPLKTDKLIYSPMAKRQKGIYEDTVAVLSKKARQQKIEFEKLDMKKLTEVQELEVTRGSTKTKEKDTDTSSNMVMVLRKIANHPLLVRRHYTDDKLKKIAKILKKTTHRDSVLEYIVEDFSVMSDFEIHTTCSQYNHIRQYRLDEEYIVSSGKMEQLDILLPKLKEEGARVLLFSQFVIVLNILEQYVKLRGYKYLRFDGTTQVSERQELIDQYTEEEDIFLFLLSTKAGGLGINLTAANTVILHDIDFNPYNDKQAEDRCHRVGQTRPVTIIRLISKGTIEEGMLQIAQDKLQLEREVTGLEEGQQKRDVGMLLKVALGLIKPEGQSSSSADKDDKAGNDGDNEGEDSKVNTVSSEGEDDKDGKVDNEGEEGMDDDDVNNEGDDDKSQDDETQDENSQCESSQGKGDSDDDSNSNSNSSHRDTSTNDHIL